MADHVSITYAGTNVYAPETPTCFLYAGHIYTTTIGNVVAWLADPGIEDQAFIDNCTSCIPDDGRTHIKVLGNLMGELVIEGYR